MARERAEASSAARRRRLRYAFGGALAVAVASATVVLATSGAMGGGGEDDEPKGAGGAANVQLPEQQTGDLAAAAKAAQCTVSNPPIEGQAHATKIFKASDYKTNPPTSGEHHPEWYEDGIYESGGAPELGKQVHTLEHGRIDVQYRAGTPNSTVAQLEALLAEQSGGYHMLLYENVSDMPYAVAATAWGHLVGCKTMNDKVFDVLRTFRAAYIDKGPESVP